MEGCCILWGISERLCVWKGKRTTWSRISQAQKSRLPICSHQHLWCRYISNRHVITMVCQTLVETPSQENMSCSSFITVFSTENHCFSSSSCYFLFFFFLNSFLLWRRVLKNTFNSKAFLFIDETGEYMKSVESFLYHYCGAWVRSWFLCLSGLCFWFCKAEMVYLEEGGGVCADLSLCNPLGLIELHQPWIWLSIVHVLSGICR